MINWEWISLVWQTSLMNCQWFDCNGANKPMPAYSVRSRFVFVHYTSHMKSVHLPCDYKMTRSAKIQAKCQNCKSNTFWYNIICICSYMLSQCSNTQTIDIHLVFIFTTVCCAKLNLAISCVGSLMLDYCQKVGVLKWSNVWVAQRVRVLRCVKCRSCQKVGFQDSVASQNSTTNLWIFSMTYITNMLSHK